MICHRIFSHNIEETMPSITSYVKQTPSSQGYFKGDVGGGTAKYTTQANFTFVPGTAGVQVVDGTNVYFDTYTNIRSFFGNSGSGTSITDTMFFRDMGKEWNIYYYQQVAPTRVNVPIHALTISKAVRTAAPGENYEGDVQNIVYLVTWTANHDATSGVPVGVTRTGFY